MIKLTIPWVSYINSSFNGKHTYIIQQKKLKYEWSVYSYRRCVSGCSSTAPVTESTLLSYYVFKLNSVCLRLNFT